MSNLEPKIRFFRNPTLIEWESSDERNIGEGTLRRWDRRVFGINEVTPSHRVPWVVGLKGSRREPETISMLSLK